VRRDGPREYFHDRRPSRTGFGDAESEQINPPILKTNQQFVDDARAGGNQAGLKVFAGRTHYSNIRKIHEPGDDVFTTVIEFVRRLSR
jgi:hypothetical protein